MPYNQQVHKTRDFVITCLCSLPLIEMYVDFISCLEQAQEENLI